MLLVNVLEREYWGIVHLFWHFASVVGTAMCTIPYGVVTRLLGLHIAQLSLLYEHNREAANFTKACLLHLSW